MNTDIQNQDTEWGNCCDCGVKLTEEGIPQSIEGDSCPQCEAIRQQKNSERLAAAPSQWLNQPTHDGVWLFAEDAMKNRMFPLARIRVEAGHVADEDDEEKDGTAQYYYSGAYSQSRRKMEDRRQQRPRRKQTPMAGFTRV